MSLHRFSGFLNPISSLISPESKKFSSILPEKDSLYFTSHHGHDSRDGYRWWRVRSHGYSIKWTSIRSKIATILRGYSRPQYYYTAFYICFPSYFVHLFSLVFLASSEWSYFYRSVIQILGRSGLNGIVRSATSLYPTAMQASKQQLNDYLSEIRPQIARHVNEDSFTAYETHRVD